MPTKKKNTDKHSDLGPVSRRFLAACDLVIERGLAKNVNDLCNRAKLSRQTIKRIKQGGKVMPHYIEALVTTFDINTNYLFRDNVDLFHSESSGQSSGPDVSGEKNLSFGNGNHVNYVGGDNMGTIADSIVQRAKKIINQAPEGLKEGIDTIISETDLIKKIAFTKSAELKALKANNRKLEQRLKEKTEELLKTKDELLEVFRKKVGQG